MTAATGPHKQAEGTLGTWSDLLASSLLAGDLGKPSSLSGLSEAHRWMVSVGLSEKVGAGGTEALVSSAPAS